MTPRGSDSQSSRLQGEVHSCRGTTTVTHMGGQEKSFGVTVAIFRLLLIFTWKIAPYFCNPACTWQQGRWISCFVSTLWSLEELIKKLTLFLHPLLDIRIHEWEEENNISLMMDNLTRVFTNNWVKIGPNVLQNKKSFFSLKTRSFGWNSKRLSYSYLIVIQ